MALRALAGNSMVESLEERLFLSASPHQSAHLMQQVRLSEIIRPGGVKAVSATISATAGSAFSGEVGSLSGLAGVDVSEWRATVAWGDRTAPSAGRLTLDESGVLHISADHTYARAGNYQVHVTVGWRSNRWGRAIGHTYRIHSKAVVAREVPPVTEAIAITATAGESFTGVIGRFTLSHKAYVSIDARVNWGDGETSLATLQRRTDGTYEVIGEHTYYSAGDFDITITLRRGYPMYYVNSFPVTAGLKSIYPIQPPLYGQVIATIKSSATVAPAGEPSQPGEGGVAISAIIGEEFAGVVGSFTYPDVWFMDFLAGPNSWYGISTRIYWGDGASSAGDLSRTDGERLIEGHPFGGVPFEVSGSHIYTTGGVYQVTVVVTERMPVYSPLAKGYAMIWPGAYRVVARIISLATVTDAEPVAE